jgi:recombination associated protein RdgC
VAKRDEARAEAAFLRGDTGLDGAATDVDQRDAAEVERGKAREQLLRGRTWLGRELLTWLLWRSEGGDPLAEVDGTGVVVLFTARVVLRGVAGDVTELGARGQEAPYAPEVRRALDAGLLVHQARLQLRHGEKEYFATLDAEFLDVRAAKLPELMAEEEDDRAAERLWLAGQLGRFVDALTAAFLEERHGRGWTKTVAAMKKWMAA